MAKENNPNEYKIKKESSKKPKLNNALIGLILGLVFTLLGILLMYLMRWQDKPFSHYLGMFTEFHNYYSMNAASRIISLSVIVNLIPFYYFRSKHAEQTVKGIVIASVLWLLLVIMYLFVWQ